MASLESEPCLLLSLPDPCLVAVLRYTCGNDDYHKDSRSLFSAARAHSRLHQAAVQAVSSIKAWMAHYEHVDSVLLYLTNHGQQITSLDLQGPCRERGEGNTLTLLQLPNNTLQGLSSLRFSDLRLQLQPGDASGVAFQGVLSAGAPLKQLQLCGCTLLDGEDGLAEALLQLPELQHLSLCRAAGLACGASPAALCRSCSSSHPWS
jgi:hypothetical protein